MDYTIEFFDKNVRIVYKGREFWTEIKDIRVNTGIRLKDEDGKEASYALNLQIINDVKMKYKRMLEEKIKGMKLLNEYEVISEFKGIRLAN